MTVIEQARELRADYLQLAAYAPDEEAFACQQIFDYWVLGSSEAPREYAKAQRVRYNGKLYRCILSHQNHGEDNFAPDVAASLFVEIADPDLAWPAWKQPLGAEDGYSKGDQVSHNGLHWISNIDANVWEPGISGAESLWSRADLQNAE